MCERAGIRPPDFAQVGGPAVVTFRAHVGSTTTQVTTQVTAQVAMQVAMQLTMQLTMQVMAILEAARTPMTHGDLQKIAGIRNRDHFRRAHLQPMLAHGWLERTIPDKPRSRLQKYRTTAAGLAAMRATESK